MCCFTLPVDSVSGTSIFARAGVAGRQYLAYSMTVTAREPLAMVLPLPTPAGSPADAVRFIPLDGYPDLFDHLAAAMNGPGLSVNDWLSDDAEDGNNDLPVVRVGSFAASFVPGVRDFGRLDARFRMPPGTWERLPRYAGYGFAVFQLDAGRRQIHPMAFEFPRADPTRLFFPTLHVHDGRVRWWAGFDHVLYAQMTEPPPRRWERGWSGLDDYVDMSRTGGLVAADAPLVARRVRGWRPNRDIHL